MLWPTRWQAVGRSPRQLLELDAACSSIKANDRAHRKHVCRCIDLKYPTWAPNHLCQSIPQGPWLNFKHLQNWSRAQTVPFTHPQQAQTSLMESSDRGLLLHPHHRRSTLPQQNLHLKRYKRKHTWSNNSIEQHGHKWSNGPTSSHLWGETETQGISALVYQTWNGRRRLCREVLWCPLSRWGLSECSLLIYYCRVKSI